MSSTSNRADSTHTALPDEYDRTDREAAFFLYTRPLEDAVLGESDDICLHHWALVAVFIDESTRTMEAFDNGGFLMPTFTKQGPPLTESNTGKYYQLILIKTSPYKLREVTRNVSSNGTRYKALGNNCQTWVKDCARAISSELAKALENYKDNGEVGLAGVAGCCSLASSRSSSRSVERALILFAQRSLRSSASRSLEHHVIS